jgi:hypothetical protein
MGTATVKQDSGSKQNHLKAALRIDDRREQCRAVHPSTMQSAGIRTPDEVSFRVSVTYTKQSLVVAFQT